MNSSSEVKSLQKFLERNSYSVRDAAAAMGLHRDTLYGWLNRGATPKPENIAQIRDFVSGARATKSSSSVSEAPAMVSAPSRNKKSLLQEAKVITSRLHEIHAILDYTD